MVLLLPKVKSFGEEFGEKLGGGLGQGFSDKISLMNEEKTYEKLGIPKEVAKLSKESKAEYFKNAFAKEKPLNALQQAKLDALERNQKLFKQLGFDLQGNQQNAPSENGMDMSQEGEQPEGQSPQQANATQDLSKVPLETLQKIAAFKGQPGDEGLIGNMAQAEIDNRQNRDKLAKETTIEDRKFHTGYSSKAVEEADAMRESLPRVQMSLDFARDAVESGKTGALSLANLGERLNIPELQTARGAQLITAAKENLIGTLSQVSARAQNQWMEQRINSMMAQIGKSEEANLASQELLEAEFAMKKAYLNEFDRIQDEDTKNFGYERKDIKKRAHNAVKPLEQHIFDRAAFRVLELQEQEEGLTKLKGKVGKDVIKGTFLTPVMAKLYVEKFGAQNALKVAEKNGYKVPSMQEFESFQARPQEFRQGFENE